MDSSPLAVAGRFEDSVKLVAHATCSLVTAVAKTTEKQQQTSVEEMSLRKLSRKRAKGERENPGGI